MSRFIQEKTKHHWVLIASHRIQKLHHHFPDECVFCEGNEKLTSEEVFRIGPGVPTEPGWFVRVIKNKYPLTDIHEVLVHSPEHEKNLEDLPLSQVKHVFFAYQQRFNTHRNKGQVLIFCNQGMYGGASQKHPHSQITVVPDEIHLETLAPQEIAHIAIENHSFVAHCPEYSEWPYEVWISPKRKYNFYGDINDGEITDLAEITQKMLQKLKFIHERGVKSHPGQANIDHYKATIDTFCYNYYISPKKEWYLRIIPRFEHRAGFELGTGLMVNVIDPVDAARELQK